MNYMLIDRNKFYDIINGDSYGIEILEKVKEIEQHVKMIKSYQFIYKKLAYIDWTGLLDEKVKIINELYCNNFIQTNTNTKNQNIIEHINGLLKSVRKYLYVDYAYVAPERIDANFTVIDKNRNIYFMEFDELCTVIEMDGVDKLLPFELYRLDSDINICSSIAICCNSENNTRGLEGCLIDLDMDEIVEFIKGIEYDFRVAVGELFPEINFLTQVLSILQIK